MDPALEHPGLRFLPGEMELKWRLITAQENNISTDHSFHWLNKLDEVRQEQQRKLWRCLECFA